MPPDPDTAAEPASGTTAARAMVPANGTGTPGGPVEASSDAPSPSALASRDFRLFLAARLASGPAQQMQTVAVGWLVYDLTRSPLALGLVGLAAFLPAVLLALVTGHVADRYDRRRVLAACHVTSGLVTLGLFAAASAGAGALHAVYALVVLGGTARAFGGPSSQAMVPSLVPRAAFASAVALNSSTWQATSIAGPALGGLLYALGPGVVFGTAAALFALAAGLVSLIALRPRDAPRERPTWATLIAGITFIRGRRVILGAISLDLFAVLLGGATALLPVFAAERLGVGPEGLGLLRAAPAVGAGAMALALARRPIRRRAGRRMFLGVGVFGLATVGFGLSTSLPLSMVLLAVLGAADMVSVVVRQTLVQAETPDAMRGRVAAVNTVFIGASNELGEFESGLLAAALGPVAAVVLGGMGAVGVAFLWARLFPELRDRDRLVEG